MARPDHGDAGLGQQLGVTAHIENDGRIVDLFQAPRVKLVVDGNDCHAGGCRTRDFFLGKLRRFSRGQRLCRDGLNVRAFQFGKRGA